MDPGELFKTTHTKKSGDWVDECSRSTYRQYNDRMSEIETQIGDLSTEGGHEVDRVTKLELWKEVVGGKKLGRCYGTTYLSSNIQRGILSLTQESLLLVMDMSKHLRMHCCIRRPLQSVKRLLISLCEI